MFLKRERTDTDDFVLKKYLVVKKKNLMVLSIFQEIIRILYTFLADTLTNIPENFFAYSIFCVSENSKHFSFFSKQNLTFS